METHILQCPVPSAQPIGADHRHAGVLIERTKQGPARWDKGVTIGEAGDPENDPTVSWPAGRKEFKAGTLSLTRAEPQKGAACEPINFDPMVMADGISPTDDPVLRFRSPAYAVSFGKRLGGQ